MSQKKIGRHPLEVGRQPVTSITDDEELSRLFSGKTDKTKKEISGSVESNKATLGSIPIEELPVKNTKGKKASPKSTEAIKGSIPIEELPGKKKGRKASPKSDEAI